MSLSVYGMGKMVLRVHPVEVLVSKCLEFQEVGYGIQGIPVRGGGGYSHDPPNI